MIKLICINYNKNCTDCKHLIPYEPIIINNIITITSHKCPTENIHLGDIIFTTEKL